jgi:hypothetical protein
LTHEQLVRESIPEQYARQVLQAARDHQVSQQHRREWQSLPPNLRDDFATALRQLGDELHEDPAPREP